MISEAQGFLGQLYDSPAEDAIASDVVGGDVGADRKCGKWLPKFRIAFPTNPRCSFGQISLIKRTAAFFGLTRELLPVRWKTILRWRNFKIPKLFQGRKKGESENEGNKLF